MTAPDGIDPQRWEKAVEVAFMTIPMFESHREDIAAGLAAALTELGGEVEYGMSSGPDPQISATPVGLDLDGARSQLAMWHRTDAEDGYPPRRMLWQRQVGPWLPVNEEEN